MITGLSNEQTFCEDGARFEPSNLASTPQSMIEQEFSTVEQSPKDILELLGWILGLFQHGDELGELGLSRFSRHRANVELGKAILGGLLARHELLDQSSLLDLGVGRV